MIFRYRVIFYRFWLIFDKRYTPDNTPIDHIVFAIKHEVMDFLILKRVFDKISTSDFENFIKATPTGTFSRRICFFYERLTGNKLNLEDAQEVSSVDALDPEKYFTIEPALLSTRHRVKDNLIGTNSFIPIIKRTEKLQNFIDLDLANKAKDIVGKISGSLISRAASFMLLADSSASFAIKGEKPQKKTFGALGESSVTGREKTYRQKRNTPLARYITW